MYHFLATALCFETYSGKSVTYPGREIRPFANAGKRHGSTDSSILPPTFYHSDVYAKTQTWASRRAVNLHAYMTSAEEAKEKLRRVTCTKQNIRLFI
jgi:hypothetical protein